MTSTMTLSSTDITQQSPRPSCKKRPQLSLQVNFLNIQKVVDKEDQEQVISKSAHKIQSIDTFSFKEIQSAETLKNIYDNYHFFKTFYDTSMRRCNRPQMEDRYCALLQQKQNQFKESFFGVFDGHKNYEISNFLKNNLYQSIQTQNSYEQNIKESIIQASLMLDKEIQEMIKVRNLKGGSTALCALIRNKTINLLNVGDSIAAIVSYDGIRQINEQHRPSNPKEQEILIQKGAVLLERSGVSRINGELAISRSFGDNEFKEFITSMPDVYSFDIQSNDQYLLLATDGFWDVINLEEANYFIKQWEVEKQDRENIDNLSSFLINQACTKITNFKKDNMTVLVVDLQYLKSDQPLLLSRYSLE
ncbi:protein phosphatase 2C containing protein (macronuclear) [Tetrahymena thermophila SB210]|uniref:Protein phosphatase 2C containing protein n=1 Tax=Tetrahymena thermophila (strain SB210) TaxID=312017 RepID=I7M9S7_TETTS|nr:protein phosphatase 2C containing protein [Tetrahymena thermophila SB210]EAS02734.4 protein phosphatase 2C containing protein [Tetrahymena thermophila SB210]|eukprot:XP_001022979.4 protein phosphatase 2C containing protein [Tetrahymena thermophila SB210]